jgi:hypothetical protein
MTTIQHRTDMISKTIKDLDFYVDVDGLKEELESIPILTIDMILSIVDKYREGMKNRCLECGTDMGRTNPRQLCGKWMCYES